MMDFSGLTDEMIAAPPRNIHRPYKPVCGPGVVDFSQAVFRINHYIGSWDRYSSRRDIRRNRAEWEHRAFLTAGTSCENAIHEWFPRFLDIMGLQRAKFLLGVDL